MCAVEPVDLPTAQELSTAKLHKGIESGAVSDQGAFVIVVCTDSGDGTPPIVLLDAPQRLKGSAKEDISYENASASSSFKGKLETSASRKGKKLLVGGYSIAFGQSTEGNLTRMSKAEFSVNAQISQGSLTMIGGTRTSMIDNKTGKRSNSTTYVFAYYK